MRLAQSRFNLPLLIAGVMMLAMFAAGPIAQLADYHNFADHRSLFGLANAADVLSNLGFLLVGAVGVALAVRPRQADRARLAWTAFFLSLVLTAAGSAWYHLAPDDARLIWDRLPIALACASLLAAVLQDSLDEHQQAWIVLTALLVCAVVSVAWWVATNDLRPYLLLQLAPLVLIPVLQWQAGAAPDTRRDFGIAIALYVLAKLFEIGDSAVFGMVGLCSGHTMKHLAAALAALVLLRSFVRRNALIENS